MINTKRLAERFKMLAQIDSESRHEAEISKVLEKILIGLGAKVYFDDSAEKVGGDCANLVAKFHGTIDLPPLFLSGHMDTVLPGRGVKVQFENGIFTSDGTTILGGDDKSALAIIIEVMETIKENHLPCPPVELVFTVCEEIGLMGAKNLDLSLLDAKFGYILDSTDKDGIVTKAPSANKFVIKVHGLAAHAGAAPEKGVSAIFAAATAISGLKLGRIDEVTTCNLGTISGGMTRNIVPEYVEIQGEARSHDMKKLQKVTDDIVSGFESAMASLRKEGQDLPRVEIEVEQDFPNTNIPEDHISITLAREAAKRLGRELESKTIGGGADANIFFGKGIVAGVLGTGMTDVHTLKESIALSDMENTALLILEILKIYAAGEVSQ